MKVTIIDFSLFNGISMMYATHYYVDGRRVSRNTYYGCYCSPRGYRHERTETRTDKNKNGVTRDYTIIHYSKIDT